MKNFKSFSLIPVLFLFGCATTHHNEKSVTQEAAFEPPVQNSAETKAKLLEILNQDASVTESEKNQIVAIVEDSFSKYKDLENLSNQKKTLLIRELINDKPDLSKLKVIKKAIKKVYEARANLQLESFEKISAVMKVHPESAKLYFKRADAIWPFRERL